MKTLYQHQENCLAALFKYFEKNNGNPVAVIPVGGGKSLVQAEFCKRAIEQFPQTKIAIVTHITELLTQIYAEFIEQWPDANISFYAAKLGKKNLTGKIILGSIQSIYKKAPNIPGGIDLLLVDECHLISPNDETMYKKFISELKLNKPNLKVIGFTGTNFRANTGLLTEGEGRLFTDVAYQIPMLELINKGFLCPLVTPEVKTRMNVTGVKTQGGDYIESQLQRAVDHGHITTACVNEIIEYGKDRKKWLVFTAGVEHCTHVTDEIKSRGIVCEMVTGETPTAERNSIVARFKNGDIQCLCCVAVFTVGFNNPAIDMLCFMRPTRSPVLYVQCSGRGMRTYPGKTECRVLDFGGVVQELGPVDTIDARMANKRKKLEPGEPPVKVCPSCNCVCFAGVRECYDCGFQFPEPEIKITARVSNAPILSNQIKEPEPETHHVIGTIYKRHQKAGKKDSLRVTYTTLGGSYSDFLFFDHSGTPREKACFWHRRILPDTPPPNSVTEALKLPYPQASEITTKKDGKFHKVISVKYAVSTDAEMPSMTEKAPNQALIEAEDIPF